MAVEAGVDERIQVEGSLADAKTDGKIGKTGADESPAYRHLPTTPSPTLKT